MDLLRFQQRVKHKNPLHPYSWAVRYRDGGRFKQFDLDGYHYSREIDRSRLVALQILGHRDSPIELPVPLVDRVPDEIILKAQVSLVTQLGSSTIMERHVRYFFGFRYGDERFLLEIDEAGRLWKTNVDEEPAGAIVAGAVLDQLARN